MNAYDSQKGFTLLEVVIAAVIIAIAAAIAVPSIRTWIPRQQIRSLKRDVVSQMQLARMRAIGTGHYCYLDFDPAGDGVTNNMAFTCFLDTDDDRIGELDNGLPEDADEFQAGHMTAPHTAGGFPAIRLPSQVRYGLNAGVADVNGDPYSGDGVTFSADRAVFYPNGSGKAGTLYFHTPGGENYAITVNIIGRIIVRKWNGTNWQ